MSSKRVSLKGKGADLFFGDYTPESQPADDAPPPSAPTPEATNDFAAATIPRKRSARARPNISESVLPIASEHASPIASKLAINTAGALADELTSNRASTLDSNRPHPRADEQTSMPAEQDDQPDANVYSAAEPGESLSESSTRGQSSISDVEAVRRIVKTPGREVAFIRLTPEEKAQVTDIVYAYKRKGQKTSETEIYRIALNFLLNDFHLRDADSLLARTLAALSA